MLKQQQQHLSLCPSYIRALDLHKTSSHCRQHTPEFSTVYQMSDDGLGSFYFLFVVIIMTIKLNQGWATCRFLNVHVGNKVHDTHSPWFTWNGSLMTRLSLLTLAKLKDSCHGAELCFSCLQVSVMRTTALQAIERTTGFDQGVFFFTVIVVLFFFCTLWRQKNWKGETTAWVHKGSIVQRQVFTY